MKLPILTAALLVFAQTSFALPSQGEFIASKCGKAPYGPNASVEVCFGTVMGAPAFKDETHGNPDIGAPTMENSKSAEALIYMQVGGSNYVGVFPETAAQGPTQPLEHDLVDSKIQMSQIAQGEIATRKGAKTLEVKIKHQNDNLVSAEITLNNGKILKVESFYTVGGAR